MTFPADARQDFADMQSAISDAQNSAQRRVPLTEASQGWILRAMGSPDTSGRLGPNDVWIYARNGRLHAKNASGDDLPLEEIPDIQIPQAAHVPNATGYGGGAPATYNQGWAQGVDAALQDIISVLNASLATERSAGLRAAS